MLPVYHRVLIAVKCADHLNASFRFAQVAVEIGEAVRPRSLGDHAVHLLLDGLDNLMGAAPGHRFCPPSSLHGFQSQVNRLCRQDKHTNQNTKPKRSAGAALLLCTHNHKCNNRGSLQPNYQRLQRCRLLFLFNLSVKGGAVEPQQHPARKPFPSLDIQPKPRLICRVQTSIQSVRLWQRRRVQNPPVKPARLSAQLSIRGHHTDPLHVGGGLTQPLQQAVHIIICLQLFAVTEGIFNPAHILPGGKGKL